MLKLFLKHVRRIFLDTLESCFITINNLDSAELSFLQLLMHVHLFVSHLNTFGLKHVRRIFLDTLESCFITINNLDSAELSFLQLLMHVHLFVSHLNTFGV